MSVDVNGAESGGQVRHRRRMWSEAEKRRIVAESYEPGVSVSLVARRHDLNANLLFTWRRQLRAQAPVVPASGFVPMMIAGDSAGGASSGCEIPSAQAAEDPAADLPPAPGRIEIVLAGGRRVIVDRGVDAAALARVIAVLERQ